MLAFLWLIWMGSDSIAVGSATNSATSAFRMGTKYELTNSSGQNLLLMLQRLQSSGSLGPAAEIFPHLWMIFLLKLPFSSGIFRCYVWLPESGLRIAMGIQGFWMCEATCETWTRALGVMDVPGPPLKKMRRHSWMNSSNGNGMERFLQSGAP